MSNSLRRKTPLIAKFVVALTATVSVIVISAATAGAKKKEKPLLPDFVWKAESVLVVILPGGGEPLDDPLANQKTKEEVDKALMKWGRYRLALNKDTADLVIAVRKGTGKLANPTISGGGVDQHPGTLETTDNSVRVGVQRGNPPAVSQTDSSGGPVHTGVEAGADKDIFKVFQSGPDIPSPVDSAAVWTYAAKDALKSPRVVAVEEFRKAVEQAEKAAANTRPQQKQPQGQQQGQKSP